MFGFVESTDLFLLLVSGGGGLLGGDELRVVDEAVFVFIVAVQDRVDHVLQLIVLDEILFIFCIL